MNLLSQAILSGLMSGAVYAILGLGLVLVYRTDRLLNLAHGETFAIAGIGAALLASRGVPLWIATGMAVVASVLFSTALYHFVLRRRRQLPVGSLILVTLAAAFVVRGALI